MTRKPKDWITRYFFDVRCKDFFHSWLMKEIGLEGYIRFQGWNLRPEGLPDPLLHNLASVLSLELQTCFAVHKDLAGDVLGELQKRATRNHEMFVLLDKSFDPEKYDPKGITYG